MASAKEDIFASIRAAVAGSAAIEYSAVPRSYRAGRKLTAEERIDLFRDRLIDYGAGIHSCSEAELPEAIQSVATSRQKSTLIVPPGFPRAWFPPTLTLRLDDNLTYDELDRCEGVLTPCALAIASTGTIVLRHSHEEGRRALTLIPDYHLCVVRTGQVFGSVTDAFEAIASFATAPITTISGPSATADIEMTRISGVHGPRVLDVIIAD